MTTHDRRQLKWMYALLGFVSGLLGALFIRGNWNLRVAQETALVLVIGFTTGAWCFAVGALLERRTARTRFHPELLHLGVTPLAGLGNSVMIGVYFVLYARLTHLFLPVTLHADVPVAAALAFPAAFVFVIIRRLAHTRMPLAWLVTLCMGAVLTRFFSSALDARATGLVRLLLLLVAVCLFLRAAVEMILARRGGSLGVSSGSGLPATFSAARAQDRAFLQGHADVSAAWHFATTLLVWMLTAA